MKVVINDDFGGFGLSDLAFEKLLERKGIAFEKIKNDRHDIVHYYKKGYLEDDEHYLSPYEFTDDRADVDLIAVLEELGIEKSNGQHASLKILEIPNDIEWQVEEYDGHEHIAEKHRTWY